MGLYEHLFFKEKQFLLHLNNAYNFFCTIYKNITLIGNFNMIPENKKLSDFCEMNNFKHLIKKLTCFKGPLPSTNYLLLTNHKQSFMRSCVYEKGLSDH